MDQQDQKDLTEAAKSGDLQLLKSMLNEDPLVLYKVTLVGTADTPLHIATLAGKTKFVKEVIRRRPSFALDLNQAGVTPLHIASALGHLEIARLLLDLGPDLCLIPDRQGLTPLHHAATNGRADIITLLLSKCPKVLNTITDQQDTAFHLAVKNRQLEAMRVLLKTLGQNKEQLLNANKEGFNVFQLAESTNHDKVVDLLNGRDTGQSLQLQVGNEQAIQIALDEQLSMEIPPAEQKQQSGSFMSLRRRTSIISRVLPKFYGFDERSVQVITALLVTVSYLGVLATTALIRKENMKLDYKCLAKRFSTKSSSLHDPPIGGCPTLSFFCFMFFNSIGFFFSTVLLLMFKRGSISQRLMALSFTSLVVSYMFLLGAICPDTVSFVVFVAPLFLIIFFSIFIQ